MHGRDCLVRGAAAHARVAQSSDLGDSMIPPEASGDACSILCASMSADLPPDLELKRLPEVDPADLIALMTDPRVRRHLPLASGDFGPEACAQFVAAKEQIWAEHGYGPWAFEVGGAFAGWGGLQPEGDDVDLGLVLRPELWGLGRALYARFIATAFETLRAPSVVILLPPSRVRVSGIARLGFRPDGEAEVGGQPFLRYRLMAPGSADTSPEA
ncbi:MAG: GNAT family protein [Bacteroidota bacterium]